MCFAFDKMSGSDAGPREMGSSGALLLLLLLPSLFALTTSAAAAQLGADGFDVGDDVPVEDKLLRLLLLLLGG